MNNNENSNIPLILIAGAICFAVLCLIVGVQEGKEREACHVRGNVPVKTDHGYVCMKREAA